jgi:glycogen synthase
VGLIPFYLSDEYLQRVPVHFTIHNATYQGVTDVINHKGYDMLDALNLPGAQVFHKYFDFFDKINIMKACMLKVHETGGSITTVSGDIAGTWGYAMELKQSAQELWQRASQQKGSPPRQVFVPNGHLDIFEKLPIIGITNGMSEHNRPEYLPELHADALTTMQADRGEDMPIFANPITQQEMLTRDHTFDVNNLAMKSELKRLLHLETFGSKPLLDPILLTAIGRLVDQKNFNLVADIIDRTLSYDGGTKFIILASAMKDDPAGKALEARFFDLTKRHPGRVYFNNTFHLPLSKLILAGGDFSLIPSRFEPCGLVDYEASLLGNIVIGRATGGLTKVANCAYLYEWLDIGDPVGEAEAFFDQIRVAIETYRRHPERHQELVRKAMTLDAGWNTSAGHYLDLYRYGLLRKQWSATRRACIRQFINDLQAERHLFTEFFNAEQDVHDDFDQELYETLQ